VFRIRGKLIIIKMIKMMSIPPRDTSPHLSINQSKVPTKPHTGKEKPHPSTATEGSKPCVTKCRRLGDL